MLETQVLLARRISSELGKPLALGDFRNCEICSILEGTKLGINFSQHD